MIKIEKVKNRETGTEIPFVLPDSLAVATIGMRNPKNSWNKTDSDFNEDGYHLGENDLRLATTLSQAGPVHGKFVRQIYVCADITAPLYWWKEFDTYKVGTVANSTSTMHKLTSRDITMEDLSYDKCLPEAKESLEATIVVCNSMRRKFVELNPTNPEKAKEYWYSLIQTLPSSYNQTRTVTMNYEVLSGMYEYRKTHKLNEWKAFCDWIETLPYAKELIIRDGAKKEEKANKQESNVQKNEAKTKDGEKTQTTVISASLKIDEPKFNF